MTSSREYGLIRLLVVDDERSILRLYQRALSKLEGPVDVSGGSRSCPLRFEVELFDRPGEAIATVRTAVEQANPFAVAFLDVGLRGEMDGVGLARRIRESDSDMHLVMVTSVANFDPLDASRTLGAADRLLYLQKPFDPLEIQQFAVALGSKWVVEKSLRRAKAGLEARMDQRTEELAEMNDRLVEEVRRQKAIEAELNEKVAELERFNRLTVGRELRMIELKKEVNGLAERLGLAAPYDISECLETP